MSELVIQNELTILSTDETNFNSIKKNVLFSLSESTKRQYRITFDSWKEFCTRNNINVFNLFADKVIDFMNSLDISSTTKRAKLSHLRKLTEVLVTYAKSTGRIEESLKAESMYQQLKMLKIKDDFEKDVKRTKVSLSKREIYEVFRAYDENTILHKRNRAILAILFYTGARRSECASLKWQYVNFEEGYIYFPNTKGSKERTVYFIGDLEIYLKEFKEVSQDREYIFTHIRRGDNFGDDLPISDNSIYRIVLKSSEFIDKAFTPHDSRRTLITNMLKNGTNIRDVQAFINHARPETTLSYAQAEDAKQTSKRVKISY